MGIGSYQRLVICGNFNCHVGTLPDGFQGAHGGKGFGVRNVEGEMLLEFVAAMGLCVVNTWFSKDKSHKVTYESGGNRTQIDYVLVRREDLAAVKDIKVIPAGVSTTT